MLETPIEKAAGTYAESLGCIVLKLNNAASSGWPDRQYITSTGDIFWIEYKKDGEMCTRIQSHRICQLIEQGCADVYAVDNKGDAFDVIDYHCGSLETALVPRAGYTDHDTARSGGPTAGPRIR